jgi:hypothetical protein
MEEILVKQLKSCESFMCISGIPGMLQFLFSAFYRDFEHLFLVYSSAMYAVC